MGIEPTSSAWKAEVLPLNYTRLAASYIPINIVVEGGGFEPPKAEPADLQSAPFGRSGTPPVQRRRFSDKANLLSTPLAPYLETGTLQLWANTSI